MRRALTVFIALAPLAAAAQPVPPTPEPEPTPALTPAPDPSPVSAEAAAPTLPPPSIVEDDGKPRPPPAGWRLMLSDLTVFRLNPLGLETRGRFGMQKRLYPSSKPITQNNFMFAGVYPKLNPVSAHLAVGGEIQPASIFNLRATVEVQKYFGILGYLQSFNNAADLYSDAELKTLRDMPGSEPQTATVLHASIQPLLQIKAGPIALRTLFQLDYWSMNLRAGDTVAYEATFDTLLPDGGWTLSTDTDLLYTGLQKSGAGPVIGIRHSWVHPFYKLRHFSDQATFDAYDNDNAHQRIGLFGAYTLRDHGPTTFNKPSIVMIVSWYLSHRWRAGEPAEMAHTAEDYTSRAFPYFLLGFAFESDFLQVK